MPAGGIASAEADYAASLAAVPNGAAKTQGIQLGQASATAILAFGPGMVRIRRCWISRIRRALILGVSLSARLDTFAFAPGWGRVTPFVLNHGSQFRSGPPYKVRSNKYAADFNELKALGGDGGTTPSARTPEQTQIGLFWIESSPLTWNRIARNVSATRGLICGRTHDCSAYSISQWPMATLVPLTPSITIISGARSPRSARPTLTAIRTQVGSDVDSAAGEISNT